MVDLLYLMIHIHVVVEKTRQNQFHVLLLLDRLNQAQELKSVNVPARHKDTKISWTRLGKSASHLAQYSASSDCSDSPDRLYMLPIYLET